MPYETSALHNLVTSGSFESFPCLVSSLRWVPESSFFFLWTKRSISTEVALASGRVEETNSRDLKIRILRCRMATATEEIYIYIMPAEATEQSSGG